MSKQSKKECEDYVRQLLVISQEQKKWIFRKGNASHYVRELIEKDIKLSTGKN